MITRISTHQLSYEEIVPSDVKREDCVLIFLHEALGSIGQWKQFPTKLCENLGLVGYVYERQGHGTSSPLTSQRTADYLHNYALVELPQFIEHVIPKDKKIILVGHSDGGTIALLFSKRFPERIVGVATMAAHVINEPETIAGIQPAVEAYNAGKLDGLRKYHGHQTDSLFFAWANIWRDSSFIHWNIVEEIGGDFPGIFIQGSDDQYGTKKQLALITPQFKRGTSLLMDNCGHHPHLEQEDVVITAIQDWYEREISYFSGMAEKFENPIDKDKITETPSILEYGHHVGSAVVKPEDQGKLKGRAMSAMEHQTDMQLNQIYQQMQLLADQAKQLNDRKVISEIIYGAEMRFQPIINHIYHLYEKEDRSYLLSIIAPDEWGRSKKNFEFVATIRLLADHTWDVLKKSEDFNFGR